MGMKTQKAKPIVRAITLVRKKEEAPDHPDWSETFGVIAEAEVAYEIPANKDWRVEHFSSDGSWGISSENQRLIEETEREQLEDLKRHLEVFGVDVSNFDSLKIKRRDE